MSVSFGLRLNGNRSYVGYQKLTSLYFPFCTLKLKKVHGLNCSRALMELFGYQKYKNLQK